MPIEVNILIDISNYGVDIPERVTVSQGTRIRFIARVLDSSWPLQILPFRNLSIQLYFEGRKPNNFKQRSIVEISSNRKDSRQEYILAEGTVEETGTYKYGVSAVADNSELFDEDPFLIVL